MTKSFAAQIKDFRDLTVEKLTLVVQESAQEVMSIAQLDKASGGRMPVDLGNLRNSSFVSGLNGSVTASGSGDAYVGVIAGMELGDVFFGGWKAEYAMRMEYGFVGTDSLGRTYNQQGNYFANSAAEQWQQIVAMNAQKARSL